MNNIQKDLITILKGYLHKDYSFNIESDLNDIRNLANKYAITPVIGYTLNKTNKYKSNIFDTTLYMNINRVEAQDNIRNTIKQTLENNNIDFIFLKGITLAKYYDETCLRYSSDIDVIVKPDDYIKAKDILVNEANFNMAHYTENELSLVNSNGFSIDLHSMFGKPQDPNNDLYKDVLYDETHELNNEYKLFHICAHGAKHLTGMGFISFQYLLDFYYVDRLDMDSEHVYKLLKDGNLYTFYLKTKELIDVLFNDCKPNEYTDLYINYLFNSIENKGRNNMERLFRRKYKKSNSVTYFLRRVFPDYQIMSTTYPILRKHKILLPFYYVKRVIHGMNKKTLATAKIEMQYYANDTKENIDSTNKLFDNLGI